MKYIIANWKMYLSFKQSAKLAHDLVLDFDPTGHHPKGDKFQVSGFKLVICPSFDSLESVGKIIKKSPFALGAQDVFWESPPTGGGAYTGEESIRNLKELGCEFIIVGHSERRHKLNETDEMVAKKFVAVARAGLIPILCIGETAAELQARKKEKVLERQLITALSPLQPTTYNLQAILIAYEPVWAIGTGTPETPENARTTHKFIREFLNKEFPQISEVAHIIYGGSVNSSNIAGFLRYQEIEGSLVGGASTKLKEFLAIIEGAKTKY